MATGVHIGEKIRQRAKELRMGPTELGKMINTSKQNVYGIFKRKSIDAELLLSISKALDLDFFQCYTDTDTINIVKEGVVPYHSAKSKTTPTQINELQQQLDTYRKELQNLKDEFTAKEIAYLKKINELLQKKK